MVLDITLGAFALIVCFSQAYRLGMDEKVMVQHKKQLAKLEKRVNELQVQLRFLQEAQTKTDETDEETDSSAPNDAPVILPASRKETV